MAAWHVDYQIATSRAFPADQEKIPQMYYNIALPDVRIFFLQNGVASLKNKYRLDILV